MRVVRSEGRCRGRRDIREIRTRYQVRSPIKHFAYAAEERSQRSERSGSELEVRPDSLSPSYLTKVDCLSFYARTHSGKKSFKIQRIEDQVCNIQAWIESGRPRLLPSKRHMEGPWLFQLPSIRHLGAPLSHASWPPSATWTPLGPPSSHLCGTRALIGPATCHPNTCWWWC